MRRLCISLVIVPSLLVAASPVQARTIASHRHEARSTSQAHVVTSPTRARTVTRPGIAKRAQKYTWGRT